MIVFWIAAALLAAAAAGLILRRAAGSGARGNFGEDRSLGVYRRQLAEIDDLSSRGLLPSDEYRSARAEAARRLLAAANDPSAPGPSTRDHSKLDSRLALAGAGAAALVALAIYVMVGSPGVVDQPFAGRIAFWRHHPENLEPAQMVAVLTQIAAEHPRNSQLLAYLARADLAAGDASAAERMLRKAITLAPRRTDLWTDLGMTLMGAAGGQVSGDSLKAFQRAHALDPTAADPRYFLALGRIDGGDVKGGLDDWRALEGDLQAGDPRKAALEQEIATVEKTGAAPPQTTQAAPPQQADTGAFIQSMVNQLAARLQAQPDDPAGWGRLIRAYGVLGDPAKRQAAVARVHGLFKDRPDALATVAAAAGGPL